MEKRKIKNIVIGSAVGIFLVVCIVVMTVITHNAVKPIDNLVGVWKSVNENAYISIDKNGKTMRYVVSDSGQITYAAKGKTVGYGGVTFTKYYNSIESDKVYTDIRDVKYTKTNLPEAINYNRFDDYIKYYPFQDDDGKSDRKFQRYERVK